MSSHPDFNIVVNLLNNISIYPIISQCSYRFPIWTPSEYINLFPVLHSLKLFLNCSQTVLVTHVLHALRVSNSISTGAKTTTSNMSRVGWREARDGSAAWGSAKNRRLCGEGSHGGQYLRGSHLVLNRRQRKRTAVAIEGWGRYTQQLLSTSTTSVETRGTTYRATTASSDLGMW